MTEEELIDGFLTDLEHDIRQYGLTESIRDSARAVFRQIIKEAGYKSSKEITEAGYMKLADQRLPLISSKYYSPVEPYSKAIEQSRQNGYFEAQQDMLKQGWKKVVFI